MSVENFDHIRRILSWTKPRDKYTIVTVDIHQMRSFALTRLNTTAEKNPFKLAFV